MRGRGGWRGDDNEGIAAVRFFVGGIGVMSDCAFHRCPFVRLRW